MRQMTGFCFIAPVATPAPRSIATLLPPDPVKRKGQKKPRAARRYWRRRKWVELGYLTVDGLGPS